MKTNYGAEIARGYLDKFPEAATQTLARIAYAKNPSVWNCLERARTCFRTLRGNCGKRKRKDIPDQRYYRKCGKPGSPFAAIPPGITHFEDWQAVRYAGPLRALLLSDIHCPYHDTVALQSALEYGLDHKANFILFNGDLLDFFSLSRWEKDPRQRNFAQEISMAKQLLCEVRSMFPKARIVLKEGNHEERWYSYMMLKAPELLDIPDFKFESVLGFEELGIERVGDKRPIQLGKLNVIHGHEYRFSVSNPVNPARGFFLRAKVSCIGGHLHQVSQHSEKNLEGKVVSCWSTGCLCDVNPDYSPLNGWSQGFAFVDVTKEGIFHVDNLRIIDGKVY
jgi:predicted phosphodiesterase